MIQGDELQEHLYQLILDAVCLLPQNTHQALKTAHQQETSDLARLHLETTLKNVDLSRQRRIPLCGDTGYPIFYVRTGPQIPIAGGIPALEEMAREVVKRATQDAWLRPSMVDPLTRDNPGTNLGNFMPHFEYKFEAGLDYLEITAAPKGGGTEIFGPGFRTLLHADGLQGIKRFVLEAIVEACHSGATCPPNIVGVGIGGTAELCMKLAKEAAVLRPIGSRHPEQRIARLEEELLSAANASGIGPMGTGGSTTILDLHIEYAPAHLAGFPVALCVQCPAARLATLRLHQDGRVERANWPDWFQRR